MITRLKVKNFRSLRELELPLGPLNVLVGPNMGGKSNIIDVFLFLQNMLFPKPGHDGLSYALAERGGIGELVWKGASDSLIAISLEGSLTELGKGFIYELEILGGRGGYTQIQKEAFRLQEKDGFVDLIVEESGRWLANSKGQRTRGESGTNRSLIQNAPDDWEGYGFLKAVGMWRFHNFVPQIMKDLNPTGIGEVLDRHGRNLSAWLMVLQTRFPEAFARIDEVARDVFPDLRGLITWPTQQGTVHLAAQERGLSRPVNVWQMSDGQLSFLALLSLIYSPADLAAPLYCIEEPENHLHPRLLSVLIRLLRQGRSPDRRETVPQIIVTTHSPQLVDEMELDEVTWVTKKDGATKVIQPATLSHLQELIQDKDLGLSDVVYSGLLAEER